MKHLLIIFLFIIKINTLENFSDDFKDSLATYEKLNHFETIIQNQNFIINASLKSIVYFDSFDKNAVVFISSNYDDLISYKDERITGKFYEIEANKTYYIRTFLYAFPSVLKKYVYPLNLDESEININDDIEEINYLYLAKNKSFTLNFSDNKIKKMIKLSHKTLNSKIKIIIDGKEEAELNENALYYQIQENFKGKIILEIEESDAFIEFLSDIGDYKVLTDLSYKNDVDKDIILVKIPKTQKNFELYLTSDDPFNCSLSYGFSKGNYYYYSKANSKISADITKDKNYLGYVSLVGAFKNINLLEDEFLSFAIILQRTPNKKISLNYYQLSSLDKIYDEEMSEENCAKIIDNLKDVLEIYVYSDIAKNPPEIEDYPNYHHKPIDLKGELDKVSKVNRKFYEFYQEIEKILTSTKDLHFNIYAHQTPKGIQFGQYVAALPFNFEIRKSDNGQYKVFIKKNFIFDTVDFREKEFFNAHLEIPLRKINDIDPFDYIQNWSKYRQTKNPHAQFTNIIDQISYFYLCNFPLEYSDLYNEYEFEDNLSIKMWNLNNFQSITESDHEFNDYFIKVFKSQKAPFQLPQLNKIKDRFLISKGFKKEKKILKTEDEKVKWDILYEDQENIGKYLKCRVDEENKVNVLVQNSFSLDFYKASEKAFDCTRLFYSNEYPIIIIEDHNGGGSANLLLLMHQILQIRTADRSYESFRISDISRKFFNTRIWNFVDMETCDIGTSFKDTYNITDLYISNDKVIEHKRTKVIDRFPREYRNALNNFREEYFNSKYAKKPTDIIIFTDSYSYSATSGFIKGFQSTGGAIIVGYYGNPTKEGTDFFDSSQSDSDVQNLESSDMYKNLNELGITIIGVTTGESYDDFYQKDNPIPREYTLEPVDYRVDIYSRYSDDLYEKFIKEGLEVHKLFNNGSYCNPKNDKLLLHDENCRYIKGDEFAHGGYKCNNQSSKWDKGECVPYYCDIGYYYDHFYNICKKECPFDENKKVFLIHEKQYNKAFKIGYNMTYKFSTLYNEDYYYSFSTSKESIESLPKLFFLKGNQNINIYNNHEEDLPVMIKSINPNLNPNINIHIRYVSSININILNFVEGKHMYFYQSLDESILYIDNIFNMSKGKIKLAKYNGDIESEDIIKVNDKYFSDIFGKINILEKNKLYIIYHEFSAKEEFDFYFTPKNKENIELTESKRNIFYLEKNKKYMLDFTKITVNDTMIKLSRKTKNAKITLLDKNVILNSDNFYYTIKDSSKVKLNLEIGNEDALIEILFKQEDNFTEIIDLEGKQELNLNKQFNFIKIPKKYSSQIITFKLNKEGKTILSLYHDYSIQGYSLSYPLVENNNGIILSNFTFNLTDHYKKDIKLMENEYYYLIIQTTENDLNINVDIELNENGPNNKEENKNKGLKTWHLILIVAGSILVLLLIIIILFICLRKKKVTNKEIEDKVQSLTEIEV